MLTVVTWLWGSKYSSQHVDRLRAGVARHLGIAHRFVCITNSGRIKGDTFPIEDEGLLTVRDGCYARLRMFDPNWQKRHGIDRLVCLDLDLLVTGKIDPLFAQTAPFKILRGGHYNPCPFNGSVMMIAAGARPEIWSGFTVEKAEAVAFDGGTWRGSDQTWIAHMAPDAAGWTNLDGIYAFRKPGWPKADYLPRDARIVAFPGTRDPSQLLHLDWVKNNWRI